MNYQISPLPPSTSPTLTHPPQTKDTLRQLEKVVEWCFQGLVDVFFAKGPSSGMPLRCDLLKTSFKGIDDLCLVTSVYEYLREEDDPYKRIRWAAVEATYLSYEDETFAPEMLKRRFQVITEKVLDDLGDVGNDREWLEALAMWDFGGVRVSPHTRKVTFKFCRILTSIKRWLCSTL